MGEGEDERIQDDMKTFEDWEVETPFTEMRKAEGRAGFRAESRIQL